MKQIFISALIAVLCPASYCHAEIAVRHTGTSENEFQALAQALGFTTVAEILTEKNAPSAEVSELFRLRLVEAQSEWLKKRDSFSAIDRFLELALEADWLPSERQAFVVFFIRRLETRVSSAKEEELFSKLNAFTVGDDTADFSEMPARIKTTWETFLNQNATDAKARLSFPLGLPTDVGIVILNGRPISRQNLSSLFLPRADVRVTLISNTYQPFTVRLTDRTIEWPTLSRKTWINDDCSVNGLAPSFSQMKLKVLGFADCEGVKAEKGASIADGDGAKAENQLAKFGLSRSSPLSDDLPSPREPVVYKKPWFWGALGVLALGAVIAVRANDNREAAVQPTNNEGW